MNKYVKLGLETKLDMCEYFDNNGIFCPYTVKEGVGYISCSNLVGNKCIYQPPVVVLRYKLE